jgi:hypothetical protein
MSTTHERRSKTVADDQAASQRWRSSAPLLAAGGAAIIVGGLAAAVTGPTDWVHGSWVAAFLVLVGGVAQIGIAIAQVHLARAAPTEGFIAGESVLWNSSCLMIVTGTLLSAPVVVTIGSGLMVAALAMSMIAVRASHGSRLLVTSYRSLVVVLLTSIPIGTALAWARR